MDVELLNPFGQHDFPESVTSTLEDWATCARFNPTGRLIAAGRADGWGTIWDVETQGVLRSLEGHVKAITTISWSRNSRYLITASRDWNCILWDVENGNRKRTIRFDSPVTGASFHPQNSKMFVAVLSTGQCIVVDTRHGRTERRELVDHRPSTEQEGNSELLDPQASSSQIKQTRFTVACFNREGSHVIVGTADGDLIIFSLRLGSVLHREKLANNASIKHLTFDPSGKHLALASSDRIVRVVEILSSSEGIEVDILHRLQDMVARTQWNGVVWTGNGEYVVGGAASKAAHTIYIWERETGRLEKMLEGPREPLLDVHWHPLRPSLLSVNTMGLIYLWNTITTEKWGAFAAGFEELDENVMYEEREDEFDIEDEEVLRQRKRDEEDLDVDITGVDNIILPSARGPSYLTNMLNLISKSDDNTAPAEPVPISDPETLAYREWIARDPDDDSVVDYFPPLSVEDDPEDEQDRY